MKVVRLSLCIALAAACLAGCSSASGGVGESGSVPASAGSASSGATASSGGNASSGAVAGNVANAVNFDQSLDSYSPQKDSYNFCFTYKIVHPWWDAVAMGMEDAARQYEDRGIRITYEYLAPPAASAADQTVRLERAAQGDFDVIGVDVADEDVISPEIDKLAAAGNKVMTFSTSDAAEGSSRIAYVGNTHNYQDGADLTQALCDKLGGRGTVAILVGSPGAPCHEDRARGAMDVIARYPDMSVVDVQYDDDSVDNAYTLTQGFLAAHPDLDGIVCCNMSNPVGAARAVVEAGRQDGITIVGMDHDQEALHYLRDGVIYCLGVQDCYSIGFETIQVAVKIADGNVPGPLFPEKTEVSTTIIYQQDASAMLQILYGEIS